MLQRILHKITELQIKVFSGQSIEKTDSKLTEIRNDIHTEIAKQQDERLKNSFDIQKVINSIAIESIKDKCSFSKTIANFEKIMNVKWHHTNKNELPERNSLIYAISAGSGSLMQIKNIGDGIQFKKLYQSWCYVVLH